MLKLDSFSENVLFQCDRCRLVGELFTDLIEDEGRFHCWGCLNEINHQDRSDSKRRKENMRLAKENSFGESLYECDQCQIVGPKDSVIIEEQNRHLCMSCRFEKERNRFRREKKSLVEF